MFLLTGAQFDAISQKAVLLEIEGQNGLYLARWFNVA